MGYKDSEKRREYNTAWTRRRGAEAREVLNRIKVERGCIDCGYNSSPYALEWDHVDGSRNGGPSVASLVSSGLSRALKEAEKCVVRCANCHRIKTYMNGDYMHNRGKKGSTVA